MDAGSSQENAIKQEPRAFSDEVDTGSSQENAIKQEPRAFDPIPSDRKTL
jgi:hypothetical protein